MHEVSTVRLYLLRGMYLLIAVGLGMQIWPLILASPAHPPHMTGVVRALLGALSLIAALGIRYPLRMLPLLLFELLWKIIWVVAIGLPLRSAGQLDAGTAETLFACIVGIVLVPLAIPWRYVLTNFVRAPADRWRAAPP